MSQVLLDAFRQLSQRSGADFSVWKWSKTPEIRVKLPKCPLGGARALVLEVTGRSSASDMSSMPLRAKAQGSPGHLGG